MSLPPITKDMLIGDVIRQYPSTEDVFRRLFGKGCFTCPGSNNEDIEFGSAMHNIDVERALKELNMAADQIQEKGNG
ncbi:MAG: DUF1858 domain-containing protein [Deltaproteobacteria bacterium]|nr:DUF1858 domain-containing protein [Deltaproteobacteria bacterium]